MSQNRQPPTLPELYLVFLKVSTLTIGGGYVMFPMLKREVVDARNWVSSEEMVDYYALGQSVPGIIAMNTATLIGYRKKGVSGALAAAAGMATPSVVVILLIAAYLTPYFDLPVVQKAFAGIRAAVVAMIAMAVYQVGRRAADSPAKRAIAAGALIAVAGLQVHPVLMIVGAGLLGWMLFRKEPGQE